MSDFDMMQDVAAVAEFGSMGAAAKVRGRPQQYISRSVRKLESLVGVTLFERHNFGVTVTPQGRAAIVLASSAARIYQDILGLREQEPSAGIRCAFAADILTWTHAESFRDACLNSGYAVRSLQSIGAASPNSALFFEKSDLLLCAEPNTIQDACAFRPLLFAEFDARALKDRAQAPYLIPKSIRRQAEQWLHPDQATIVSDLRMARRFAASGGGASLEPTRYCILPSTHPAQATDADAPHRLAPAERDSIARVRCGLYFRKVDASRFDFEAIEERLRRKFADQHAACCDAAGVAAI